ncbi:DUF4232 domain-containing protein [Streptomyces sp. NPDC085946]|uniref:DUF4232 domain-containing protein n=1 Tax=Streptomyces sp. NPDC085946 TaxID=3365744 RepID=UPI0037CFA1DC
MRALPAATAALAAALLLTACDEGGAENKSKEKEKAAGTACAIDRMGVETAANAAPAAGDTGTVTVTLTNRGDRCTLRGFPGVDLVGAGASATVPVDEAAPEQRLTLAENATASFTLTYVRGAEGAAESLAVRKVTFALPGATATRSFAWSYGDVARKAEGDAPDASVSGFQTAGD